MKEIQLTKGHFAIVDDGDYQILIKFRWTYTEPDGKQYAYRQKKLDGGKTKSVFMHREIMNCPDGLIVDHINGNGLDNRRENLRICTQSENLRSRKKAANTSSIYRGVCFYKGRYIASTTDNGNNVYLGKYKSEVEAAKAYNKFARDNYGEFAQLNIIRHGINQPYLMNRFCNVI